MYTEAIRTFWMRCYKIGCILFNTIFTTLHDRRKKNEVGDPFVDSPSLACKIWSLENNWEALLICNLEHWNAKQVFNTMTLWYKTQSKKMRHSLNKQNFWVSYTDVRRQSKKWENDIWMKRVVLPPYWRYYILSVHIAASITLIRNLNPYLCIFANSSLFQSNAEVSKCCPSDAVMYKSVEKSQRYLPTPLGSWKIHRCSLTL